MNDRSDGDASNPLAGIVEIRSREGVRVADAAGPAVALGSRLQGELDTFIGLRLSEFAVSGIGIRFIFWEQDGSEVHREISSSEEDIELTTRDAQLGWVPADSDTAVLAYLSALKTRVVQLRVVEGRLDLLLEEGLRLAINWNPHYEGWEIASGDVLRGGSRIVSCPGGDLAVWYTVPPAPSSID